MLSCWRPSPIKGMPHISWGISVLESSQQRLEQGKIKKNGNTDNCHLSYTELSRLYSWVWRDKQSPTDSEWTRDTTDAAQVILTSLKRCRGILPTSIGLRSAMFTNFASSTATAHITWTHLSGQKRGKRNHYALGQQRMLWSLSKHSSIQVCHKNHKKITSENDQCNLPFYCY